MFVSSATVGMVMRYAPRERIEKYLPLFIASHARGQIDSVPRLALYMAQLAHESGEWRYMEELDTGWRYDISHNAVLAQRLGNVDVGDGPKYKGRGVIQLTGKANYAKYGAILNLPLVDQPSLAARPEHAFELAAAFWVANKLNERADRKDVVGATKIINGGTNGLAERLTYYARALDVLAKTQPPVSP
jgi:putative chitinase